MKIKNNKTAQMCAELLMAYRRFEVPTEQNGKKNNNNPKNTTHITTHI